MRPKIIFSPSAPEPVGPYSQAIEVGNFIFVSGQLPLDPDTVEIVGSTIAEQTAQALGNIEGILEVCGLGLQSLVKITVYLRSMNDFAEFNRVYEEKLNGWKPARAVVEVSALPKDVLIEIEAVACR